MTFTLDQVMPWGRNLDEYRRMFDLSDGDRARRIIGCGDGPASFNAEWTESGGNIVSIDPIYIFSTEMIRQRIIATRAEIVAQTEQNADQFVWTSEIPDIDSLSSRRMSTMNRFLNDFHAGFDQGRYIPASLPELPFQHREFDLAICSHFLFLYSEQFSEDFHVQSILSMLRVAGEARIFPILDLSASQSKHVRPVIDRLSRNDLAVEVVSVDYEFQRGGNKMLRVVDTGGLAEPGA